MDGSKGLERFLEAQVGDYDDALSEISAGKKQSHWIWYVFPQMKGLGIDRPSFALPSNGRRPRWNLA